MSVTLKGCSRCGGDTYKDDLDEITCLQCGHVRYPVRKKNLPEWLQRDPEPRYDDSRSGHSKWA